LAGLENNCSTNAGGLRRLEFAGKMVPVSPPNFSPCSRAGSLPSALLLIALLTLSTFAQAEEAELTRLLRFPDIHEDRIAFVYAGDIWVADASGGVARRLTSHEGLEVFPKFSPDGRWIAFSGEYGGNRQVFVISVDGGTPRQLTWYNDVGPMPPRGGFDYRILTWTPDGENVIVRANRLPWGVRMGRYYSVPVHGGLETPLVIPEGGGGDLSPDGTKMAYTPIDREFRTWKRYRGGRAQDVWIYDLKANTAEPITDFEGTDNQPVWVGSTIYFTSDRDRTLNLYAYDPADGTTKKVTRHTEYDVLWPSGGPGGVVYENGGYIYRYDPTAGNSERVPIRVYGDLPHTFPYFDNVASGIASFDISPSGARALFDARGELFTVPAENGEVRNLTRTPGIREIDPAWSPDGQWVAYLSDRDGEYDLYVRSQDGTGDERRITRNGDIWRFPPIWSPDSQKLAFADKTHTLRYVDVEGGKIVDVDQDHNDDITTYVWAPDSRWLAYTKESDAQQTVIWAYSLEEKKAHALTDGLTNDFSPVFDPEGRYLYFLSQRDFNLTFSDWEFSYLYTDSTRIYVASLTSDTPLPFVPRSDEEEPAAEESAEDVGEEAEPEGDEEETALEVRIDVEGFANRVIALMDETGNYDRLTPTTEGLLYLADQGDGAALNLFNLESEEVETLLEDIDNYILSRDETKVLYQAGGDFGIVDAAPGQESTAGRLDLDGMRMRIDPRAEWAQMYTDGWRILRDWFYDPGMHGVDWEKMRKR